MLRPWHPFHRCSTGSDRECSSSCLSLLSSTFRLAHGGLCTEVPHGYFPLCRYVWGREADQHLNHDKLGKAQYLKRPAMQPRTITAPKSGRLCLQMGRTYWPVSICTSWPFRHQHCRCFSGRLVRVGPFYFICQSVPDTLMFSVMWEPPWWGPGWGP